jgi:hypothetical protein
VLDHRIEIPIKRSLQTGPVAAGTYSRTMCAAQRENTNEGETIH